MKSFKIMSLILCGFLIFFGANNAESLAADVAADTSANPGSIVADSSQTAEETAAPETQWLWGEIVSLDPAKNQLNVRYLDYENDTEKEITITVNEKTIFENSSSYDQLKPKDTVSVDYLVTPEGVNLAKNVSMEKPEEPVLDSPVGAVANPETATQQPESTTQQAEHTEQAASAGEQPQESVQP